MHAVHVPAPPRPPPPRLSSSSSSMHPPTSSSSSALNSPPSPSDEPLGTRRRVSRSSSARLCSSTTAWLSSRRSVRSCTCSWSLSAMKRYVAKRRSMAWHAFQASLSAASARSLRARSASSWRRSASSGDGSRSNQSRRANERAWSHSSVCSRPGGESPPRCSARSSVRTATRNDGGKEPCSSRAHACAGSSGTSPAPSTRSAKRTRMRRRVEKSSSPWPGPTRSTRRSWSSTGMTSTPPGASRARNASRRSAGTMAPTHTRS
mmetsp:Transcript_5741/g.19258  ORF Transcript_5741/g.19258 Transcript_5741/m.19258 type:complete len:263 (-) Transcript_5741:474-1262(-)